jgi:hypothetical protein
MNKKTVLIVVAAILVTAAVVGGGVYLLTANKDTTSTNNNTNSSIPSTPEPKKASLTGNEAVQAVLDKVKANTPTVTVVRVYTEDTDDNKALGKTQQYQYAGAFYDTRTNPTEPVTSNYATSVGGVIEIYANEKDAKARGEYLANYQTGAIQAGAYKVVGVNVLRVSENYTASQQQEMLALMESAL